MGEMQPKSDAQLLREYAGQGAESSFAEIVSRHTNLVYSAAVRQVDSPAVAAEIAQSVCIGLARGAQELVGRALEILRESVARRGVATAATALTVIISANAVQAAPVGLAVTISAAALVGTTLATTATVAATKTIAMTTLQKALIAAT